MALVRLIEENFKSFKPGYFPTDMTAIGEYHFMPPEGYTGIWYEPNKDTGWGWFNRTYDKRCWMIKEREGEHDLECEQLISPDAAMAMLVTGENEWTDYEVSCRLWLLTGKNNAGLAFRYSDSRHFYFFSLAEASRAVLYKKCEDSLDVLAEKEMELDCDTFYTLKVAVEGNKFTCYIDGRKVFDACDDSYKRGKVGIASSTPARFTDFVLDMEQEKFLAAQKEKKAEAERIMRKRAEYPQPRLWKILDLKDFGAARSFRYGDLTGNGKMDFLFVQYLPLLNTHDEAMISCITAVDLDGNVLWQIGEPNPENEILTADVAVQIYDIDGDGFNEVIYCKDFKIIVADGRTGRTKYWTHTPKSIYHEKYKIYQNVYLERIIGDSIRICNFSGNDRPSDILIKDRYNNIWVYDSKLNFKWHRHVNTGHFPMSFDINGDGKDELMVGHTLLDSNGELIWELPNMVCHVDEIVIGRFDPDNDKYLIALASGEDGFLLVDQDGKILVQDHLGHAQRVSVADYRPDIPGLEIAVTTFWGNTGIIAFYDCKGNRIYHCEPGANGNVICPVNWTGDGRELMLYSASRKFGGLVDGYGDRVVVFPDDGHPELCCDAVDLMGDEREEILVWDQKRMYIYTQEDNPKKVDYVPIKYAHYNFSNYRGEYSFRKEHL